MWYQPVGIKNHFTYENKQKEQDFFGYEDSKHNLKFLKFREKSFKEEIQSR
jgi:hypothetical protein